MTSTKYPHVSQTSPAIPTIPPIPDDFWGAILTHSPFPGQTLDSIVIIMASIRSWLACDDVSVVSARSWLDSDGGRPDASVLAWLT